MKETPIIYQPESIRAILKGNKTQTRRTWGLKELNKNPDYWVEVYYVRGNLWRLISKYNPETKTSDFIDIRCPYGTIGDHLWAKETWDYYGGDEYLYQQIPENVIYKTDDTERIKRVDKWQSSMFMFRWASRIEQEITLVRLQRLKDITYEDARAEGIIVGEWYVQGDPELPKRYESTQAYIDLWDKINGKKYPSSMNPWLWALTTKRIEK